MPDITNVLSAIGQEARLDILKLLSDAPEASLASAASGQSWTNVANRPTSRM